MPAIRLTPIAFALAIAALSGNAFAQSQTFHHTGANQSVAVPAGATSATVVLNGAGGSGAAGGGKGGQTIASFGVTPGEVLVVIVGGAGGGLGGFGGGG